MIKELLESDHTNNISTRLLQQIEFIAEIDNLKQILRRTFLLDKSRNENSAEHSWHLAIMAMVLVEYAGSDVDINRVLRMLLIHDLVEIDAGDTFLFDESVSADLKAEREQMAAERIFNLLPSDLAIELRALWEEFEARQTADAIFAASMDRLQPLLQNYFTKGGAWQQHGITVDKVLAKKYVLDAGSPELAKFADALIADAVDRGFLKA